MADFNSSLPVRTETNGDVAVKVVDGTTVSQALSVDSSGRVTTKLDDGNGNIITSQANGAQRALDVGIDVAGVQIDPRSIRALTSADVVTANQGTANTAANGWPVKPTDGTNSQSFTAAGEAKVSVTQPLPAGTNNIGSVNQGTSPWVTKDQADGPVTPGTVASFSELVGGQFNTSLPTLTAAQQSAMQLTSKGELITIQDIGGAPVSNTNPLPVSITSALVGTSVNDYNTAASLAAAGTSNHTYTITSSKTFNGKKIWASASGKLKIEVQISPDGSTFTSKWVGFNSTANPNISIDLDELVFLESGVSSAIRVIRTNEDKQSMDVYSTISGTEV